MAKALFGHMATNEAVLAAEVRQLRGQVKDLKSQVTTLQSRLDLEDTLLLSDVEDALREPVLS
jgi:predicted nuclease with TOPRIM domain